MPLSGSPRGGRSIRLGFRRGGQKGVFMRSDETGRGGEGDGEGRSGLTLGGKHPFSWHGAPLHVRIPPFRCLFAAPSCQSLTVGVPEVAMNRQSVATQAHFADT
jgi:hypothetical protein